MFSLIKNTKKVILSFLLFLSVFVSVNALVFAYDVSFNKNVAYASEERDLKEANTKIKNAVAIGPIKAFVANIVSFIFVLIIKFEVALIKLVIGFLAAFLGYNNFINELPVVIGWAALRDFANSILVLALIATAFGTIVRAKGYDYKQKLPEIILAAILVNYSRLICGIIIDISQVFLLTFFRAVESFISQGLLSALGITNLLSLSNKNVDITSVEAGDAISLSQIAVTMILASVFLFLMFVVITLYSVMLGYRIVMLWLHIITAPLAYVLKFVPKGEKYVGEWWTEFGNLVIMGPLLTFFLWLSIVTLNSNEFNLKTSLNVDSSSVDGVMGNVLEMNSLKTYIIAILLLYGGWMMAIKMSSKLSPIIDKAKKGLFATMKWAGKKAAGATGVIAGWSAEHLGAMAGYSANWITRGKLFGKDFNYSGALGGSKKIVSGIKDGAVGSFVGLSTGSLSAGIMGGVGGFLHGTGLLGKMRKEIDKDKDKFLSKRGKGGWFERAINEFNLAGTEAISWGAREASRAHLAIQKGLNKGKADELQKEIDEYDDIATTDGKQDANILNNATRTSYVSSEVIRAALSALKTGNLDLIQDDALKSFMDSLKQNPVKYGAQLKEITNMLMRPENMSRAYDIFGKDSFFEKFNKIYGGDDKMMRFAARIKEQDFSRRAFRADGKAANLINYIDDETGGYKVLGDSVSKNGNIVEDSRYVYNEKENNFFSEDGREVLVKELDGRTAVYGYKEVESTDDKGNKKKEQVWTKLGRVAIDQHSKHEFEISNKMLAPELIDQMDSELDKYGTYFGDKTRLRSGQDQLSQAQIDDRNLRLKFKFGDKKNLGLDSLTSGELDSKAAKRISAKLDYSSLGNVTKSLKNIISDNLKEMSSNGKNVDEITKEVGRKVADTLNLSSSKELSKFMKLDDLVTRNLKNNNKFLKKEIEDILIQIYKRNQVKR